ncbi:MAG: flagellar hook-length control protein FliK [Mariniblastus sp.]|nr:flagellar hook-length control protein FliK [Mariniblastus sp.]MDG2182994.1 flagellar hook-length control protein FliK [Mariniblastus sp.]
MNIPSLPIDVPLRENDSVADEPLNSPLPSGRTFESFTEAVEENNSGAAGVSEIAAPPELDDLNIESGQAIPLIVQSTGVEPELSVFAEITAGSELNETAADLGVLPGMVDALATQTQVVYAMSDEVVVLPADGAEGIDSGLLSGLQAVIGAKESGFEFSQGNENESESTEPNLKAALPGLIQEDSTLLNRGSRTTALTAGKMEAVTETVTENLVQQIRLTERGEQKQMTLQLHPSELGQLTLQLDWDKDVLQVKILASEMVAADLLKQNKSQLVQALAENGIDFDSLDIGYQSEQSDPRDESEAESRFMSADSFNESEEAKPSEQPVPRASSSMIDIRV